ncbi:MAG: c-type cytochrome [Gemmatimonadaceae bacterium]
MTLIAMYRRCALLIGGLAVTLSIASCKRETREFRQSPPASAAPLVRTSELQPGPAVISNRDDGPYDQNAYAMSEGQALFSQMNCVGCHANGGGGIGPALMDAEWIYGSEPSQVFATIVQGRPNGMPSFRGKLTNDQVWELVAYVRSLGGIGRRDVRPGRRDHMESSSSPQNTHKQQETNSGVPAASEMP